MRLQVSEGKELTEICENICEHCLAPDTSSGAGIGCDNMTFMVAAILHGRTKEEWAAWITERVKNEVGYKTPTTLPQLYAQSRLAAFKQRRTQWETRGTRNNDESAENLAAGFLANAGLSGFARVLGTTGGLSFHPGGQILSDTGHLMFGNDESDEDESGDEDMNGRSLYSHGGISSDDPTSLRGQLEAFEHDVEMGSAADSDQKTPVDTPKVEVSSTSAPADSQTLINGTPTPAPPVAKLESTPGDDAPSAAAKAEGLMDTSEDPLKQ